VARLVVVGRGSAGQEEQQGEKQEQKQGEKQEQQQEQQQQMRQQKELEEELGHWGGVARPCVLLRLALALWRCQLYRPANACVCFLAFY
jgi:hypothetical protein